MKIVTYLLVLGIVIVAHYEKLQMYVINWTTGGIQMEWMTICLTQVDDFMPISWK